MCNKCCVKNENIFRIVVELGQEIQDVELNFLYINYFFNKQKIFISSIKNINIIVKSKKYDYLSLSYHKKL